jgi:hypothetical protein
MATTSLLPLPLLAQPAPLPVLITVSSAQGLQLARPVPKATQNPAAALVIVDIMTQILTPL